MMASFVFKCYLHKSRVPKSDWLMALLGVLGQKLCEETFRSLEVYQIIHRAMHLFWKKMLPAYYHIPAITNSIK